MLFSHVWSENAALFKRLMELHSNAPILYYMALNHTIRSRVYGPTDNPETNSGTEAYRNEAI